MVQYVEVVFPLPLESSFTYGLPEDIDEVFIGQRVLAPLRNRRMTGYVIDLPTETVAKKIKPIEAVLDDVPLLTDDLVSLAKKMSLLYGVPLGEAVATILPAGLTQESRRRVVATDQEGEPFHPDERAWLSRLRKGKGLDWIRLSKQDPAASRLLRRLQKEGWVEIRTILRKQRARVKDKLGPAVDEAFVTAPTVELFDWQEAALGRIVSALEEGVGHSFLLHGITGSGKTEIYLQAASQALSMGKSVLALVPEISLTPQFVGRFRARLGDRIAVLHSGRSESERLTEWMRIRRGEVDVVVGARSAVFAPLKNIGLIVIDEEHDSSYKQDEGITYHAKNMALERATESKAVSVLGSATPSLESYEDSSQGKIDRLELLERATGQELPSVALVDLRAEFSKYGEKGLFSKELREAIAETLERGEQTVLFLNRRGFAPLVLCPTCGESLRCPECSVTLTYHREAKAHLCHYCQHTANLDTLCPKCQTNKFVFLGVGTERVEQELNFHFPDSRVGRLDRDAVSRRGGHQKVLLELASGKLDILVGTQMVTKGMDFPSVTLVGVLLADQSLHFPDFRAAEQTFQLLTQVVGRSGRGERRGSAIIQTFQPEHYAIAAAAKQNYKQFFNREIEFRREAHYPPFASLALLEIFGKDETAVRRSAIWLGKQAREKLGGRTRGVEVMGPAPAPMRQVRSNSRYHMILRSPRGSGASAFGRWLIANAKEPLQSRGVSLRLDIDPQRFL